MAARFNFSYGKQDVAHYLYENNPNGIYAAVASPLVYNDLYYGAGIGPNPVDVNANDTDIRIYLISDPDVLYVDSPGTQYEGNRIDQGLSAGCDFIINWLDTAILSGTYANQDVGIDGARVQDGLTDTKYAVPADFFNAWLYYLGRLNTEYRPTRKVIINLGSCTLTQYQNIIDLTDGNFFEDICPNVMWFYANSQDITDVRSQVADEWPKMEYAAANSKICGVGYSGSVIFGYLQHASPRKVEITDTWFKVYDGSDTLLGTIDFTNASFNTLAKVRTELVNTYGFDVPIVYFQPWSESASEGAFEAQAKALITDIVGYYDVGEIHLKKVPPESFQFGYALILMAAGQNSYMVLRDELSTEYTYDEMDWVIGVPLGDRTEVATNVWRREFQNYSVIVNISDSTYNVPEGGTLASLRALFVEKSAVYTRGDYGSLPTDDANLEIPYTVDDIADVATVDGIRVSQSASSQYAIHEFKNDVTGKNSCTVTWTGQTNLGNSEDYPTILEIYNTSTSSWEELTRDTSTLADTNFELKFPISSGLDNYKDTDGFITCRVYQSSISR